MGFDWTWRSKMSETPKKYHAGDSFGEFTDEFIQDVLDAEERCKDGKVIKYDTIEKLLASLDE